MTQSAKHRASSAEVLLLNNGPYINRGCEAIVRGTMNILRSEFQELSVTAGVIASSQVFEHQISNENDDEIQSFAITPPGGKRWSRNWILDQSNRRLGTKFFPQSFDLSRHALRSNVALEIGGDHYSLDYGRPDFFVNSDRYLQKRGIPVVLWGASVGPFDAEPKYAQRMFSHLRSLAAVMVRESDSFEYLRSNGVEDNVHLVADPAFLMEAERPPDEVLGFEMPENAIGINISKMVAYYRGEVSRNVRLDDWIETCVDLVRSASDLGRPIVLVPHVGSAERCTDDFELLFKVQNSLLKNDSIRINCIAKDLSAAQMKWVISKCSVFAGARTHATIAGLSSGVPTLSIGYSQKANGINRDCYGNLEHLIHVADLSASSFGTGLEKLLNKEADIRTHLAQVMPLMRARAQGAGHKLRELLSN